MRARLLIATSSVLMGCGARPTYIPVAPDPADFVGADVGPIDDTGETTPTPTPPTPTPTPSADTGDTRTDTGSTGAEVGFVVAGNALDGWTSAGLQGELCVDAACLDVDGPFSTTAAADGEFVMTLTAEGYGSTHTVKTEGLNGDYTVFATPGIDVDKVYTTAGVVRDPAKATITVRHAGLRGEALPVPSNGGLLVYTDVNGEVDPTLTELGRGHAYVLNVEPVGISVLDVTPCIPTYNQAVRGSGTVVVNLVAGEVAMVTATCY